VQVYDTINSSIFYHAMLAQCAVMTLHVVRLSVTIRYRDQRGWNSSKIISRLNSLRPVLSLTPSWAIWCNGTSGTPPKISVE